jgi:hypothetical protein
MNNDKKIEDDNSSKAALARGEDVNSLSAFEDLVSRRLARLQACR